VGVFPLNRHFKAIFINQPVSAEPSNRDQDVLSLWGRALNIIAEVAQE
jgi:hypothetical protein